MRVISVLGFKGGIGKSTVAMTVAAALAGWGQRVLLIDCDLQANTSTLADGWGGPTLTGVLRGQTPIEEAITTVQANLDLLPSDHDLDQAAASLVVEGRRGIYRLKKGVETMRERYDFVLLDHSPSYSTVTEAGLLASGEMLVPAQLAPFAVDGLRTMFDKLEQTLVDHELALTGLVPTMVDARLAQHKAYREELVEMFGARVLTGIRVDSSVPKAQSFHMTVLEYDPECRAAQDFRAVASEVLCAVPRAL